MTILLGTIFAMLAIASVVAVLVGLPGTWILLSIALLVEVLIDGSIYTWWILVAALILTLIGEGLELLAGALGAKRAGASKSAMVWAVVGGMVGAILGTFLIPIPVLGTILGSALGSGACAALAESRVALDPELGVGRARRMASVGSGAFVGRLLAVIAKSIVATTVAVGLTAPWVVAVF